MPTVFIPNFPIFHQIPGFLLLLLHFDTFDINYPISMAKGSRAEAIRLATLGLSEKGIFLQKYI